MDIVIVVGRARAGKDAFADFLRQFWKAEKFDFSSILVEEAEKRGLDARNKLVLAELGEELRKKFGMDVIARRLWEKIRGLEKAILVGPRSPEEIEFLKERVERFCIVEVFADLEIRAKRAGEPVDIVLRRDLEDEEKGLSDVLKLAEIKIDNNGTLEELKEKAKWFAKNIEYFLEGLRCGLEIHQQLDTHKLFCRCPSILREDEPDVIVERFLRPVPSEMGEFDPAALAEFRKGLKYVYQAYSDTTCLVELDEEPPGPVNREALEIALSFALLVNAKPVDEIHVMRKTVIDGSNTTGFQRTMLVALDGRLDFSWGTVRIPTICLEEDAARIVERGKDYIVYRLDRLGIPLIEITTGPDMRTPKQTREVAERIGLLLRMLKVKRGLGTIRQDLNISIRRGARVEIKGAQELELLEKIVHNEFLRQKRLLELRDIVKDLPDPEKPVDLTEIFRNTRARFVKKALERGEKVRGVKFPKARGVFGFELCPGRRFGTEVSDYVKVHAGLGGILHSDELPAYGISEEEVEAVRKFLECGEEDAFVLLIGPEELLARGFEVVRKRFQMAREGVPEETRAANPDGTTRYMRPLPGAARMYPETDIAPVPVTPEWLEEIKKKLPKKPEELIEEYVGLGLSQDTAQRLLRSRYHNIFRLALKRGADPKIAAFGVLETLVRLRREGIPIDTIPAEKIALVLAEADKLFSKKAIDEILSYLARNPKVEVSEAVEKLGLRLIPLEKLYEEIKKLAAEVEPRRLLGEAMRQYAKKARTEDIRKAVEKVLHEEYEN